MSETYKVKLEKPFSCIGNVFAVDSSLLMGDPTGFPSLFPMARLEVSSARVIFQCQRQVYFPV